MKVLTVFNSITSFTRWFYSFSTWSSMYPRRLLGGVGGIQLYVVYITYKTYCCWRGGGCEHAVGVSPVTYGHIF